MHDVQMGLIDISESEWPSFLYPQGTSWDLDDDKTDLFRGYLLLAVSQSYYNICAKKKKKFTLFIRFSGKSSLAQGQQRIQGGQRRVVRASLASTI